MTDDEQGETSTAADHVDILVVDDDAKTHVAVQAMLGPLGVAMVSVASGKEALLRLLRQDFALILLDVHMPDIDGFATAELIRGRDQTRHTPIIFLTADNPSDAQQLRGYALGAVDFLFKPIVPAILRSKVQVFVDLHRKNLELRRQAVLIREAEEREHEQRLADARRRWEADSLAQTNARLSLLSDTANRLLCGQQPRAVLDELVRRLAGQLALDVYACHTLSDDGTQLMLQTQGGLSARAVEALRVARLGDGLPGRCAMSGRMLIVDEGHGQPDGRLDELGAAVCFPLVADDRLIGTLTFGAHRPLAFASEDLATLQLVSDEVAIALERQRLVDELQARNAQLADADRRKDEFLAMLGHELRNPLMPIVNALHVIGRQVYDQPALARAHGTVERQVRHLVRLVDDLLDVGRITQGKIELRRERTDLRNIVEEALAIARPMMRARAHRLDVSLPDTPIELWADVTRLTQVVANLLNNAAKYTDRGGSIALEARAGAGLVTLSVRDTGLGLAPDMLTRVFDLFVQVDHGPARATGGLGIGLTLVKRLVQLHGGDVVARSEGLGRGSEFVVTLPLPVATATIAPSLSVVDPNAPIPVEPGGSGPVHTNVSTVGAMVTPLGDGPGPLNILVIEDNADIRETLKEVLEICGHHVTLAADGNLGIAAAAGLPCDVALIDIGLPGRDGYEVARALADLRQRSGHPRRLIAMTGYGQAEDRRRALAAGFDAHLVKPIAPELLTRLFGVAGDARPQGGA